MVREDFEHASVSEHSPITIIWCAPYSDDQIVKHQLVPLHHLARRELKGELAV